MDKQSSFCAGLAQVLLDQGHFGGHGSRGDVPYEVLFRLA